MATQNNTQVRDGLGALVTRRSYDKDGARADAPFIPEIGETSDAAWDGTSSAGLIGILKAIWTKLGGIGLKVGASALSVTNPMFVSLSNGASGVTPVTGSLSATGYSAPFTPVPGRPFNFTATGTFVGTLVLERSFDGGVTMVALTALGSPLYTFTGPFSESYTEDESGVRYFIHCTSYTSGTINYRMSA